MVMTLTGCINENWTDVILSMRVITNDVIFVADNSDIAHVADVYQKALLATGKVEAMGSGDYVIRRMSSAAEVAAIAQEAMDKANAELKDYKSKNRSLLQVAYVYKFNSEPDMEIKSPNYGISYTEADVESVTVAYLLKMVLKPAQGAEESTLTTFKEMTKGFAVNYYNVETGKTESKSLTFDETFEVKFSAKTLSKAGYTWYVEPKEEGKIPTTSIDMTITMQAAAEVSFKDGRKAVVEIGYLQFAGDELYSQLSFQEEHMAKLCNPDDRTPMQGGFYTYGWSAEAQNFVETK